jgi:phosphoribosylaminoimidazole-succinocarboxamide synthase
LAIRARRGVACGVAAAEDGRAPVAAGRSFQIRLAAGGDGFIISGMADGALLQIELPGIKKLRSGKVREVFDLGERLLIVATDRISAFDCVMPNGIPRKGEILTQLSLFWFRRTAALCANHLFPDGVEEMPWAELPRSLDPFRASLARRSMLVRKAEPLPIECVVRGYLAGSGWKEYKQSQAICGVPLPPGLVESGELPEPIFTPATKAEAGHDLNITFAEACRLVGEPTARRVRALSLELYRFARDRARRCGILIADTKFEFGLYEGELLLIDEALTPDSSRFWPAAEYAPGRGQASFDKQFVRDYLEGLDWDKAPPAPALPPEVVWRTQAKYIEAYTRLTGEVLPAAPSVA